MFIQFFQILLASQLAFAAVTYSYDAAGRLSKIDYGTGGSIVYTYDPSGNLTSRTVLPAASASGGVITSPATVGSPAPAAVDQNTPLDTRSTHVVPAETSARDTKPKRRRKPTQLGGELTVKGK